MTSRLQWTALALALLAQVGRADTGTVDLSVEAAAAVPLTNALAGRTMAGLSGAVRGDLPLWRGLALQVGVSGLALGTRATTEAPLAVGVSGGGGVRFRLLDDATGYLFEPNGRALGDVWVDAQANVVFTGAYVRPGVEVGLGGSVSVFRPLSIGVFARYTAVVQSYVVPGTDASSAGVLSVGVSFSVALPPGAPPDERPVLHVQVEATPLPVVEPPPPPIVEPQPAETRPLVAERKPEPDDKKPEAKPAPVKPRPVERVAVKLATLSVKSTGRAEVTLDGKVAGATPLKLKLVVSQKYSVRVDCLYPWGRHNGATQPVTVTEEGGIATLKVECNDTKP